MPLQDLSRDAQSSQMIAVADGPGTDDIFLTLTGHLFDTGLFNEVLNTVEEMKGSARMLQMRLGSTVNENSEVTFQLMNNNNGPVGTLADKLRALASDKKCEASMTTPNSGAFRA